MTGTVRTVFVTPESIRRLADALDGPSKYPVRMPVLYITCSSQGEDSCLWCDWISVTGKEIEWYFRDSDEIPEWDTPDKKETREQWRITTADDESMSITLDLVDAGEIVFQEMMFGELETLLRTIERRLEE